MCVSGKQRSRGEESFNHAAFTPGGASFLKLFKQLHGQLTGFRLVEPGIGRLSEIPACIVQISQRQMSTGPVVKDVGIIGCQWNGGVEGLQGVVGPAQGKE